MLLPAVINAQPALPFSPNLVYVDSDYICAKRVSNCAMPEPAPQQSLEAKPTATTVVVFRQTFLFVGLWYGLAVVLSVVLVVLGGVLEAIVWAPLAPAVPFITILLCLVPFLIAGIKHLQQWSETYTLTDDRIEVSTGILTKTTRNIPLSKVQDVTVEQTLLHRLFGLGNVVVDSASASRKIILRWVVQPHSIADQILHRAGAPLP